MRVVSVVGARPQFVKLGATSRAFAGTAGRIEHVVVHTGQHYDPAMSEAFFADLGIPAPAVNLGVGSGSHGVQTGAMLAALDEVLPGLAPDWVLVYGDTNSTLAAALSAVKLHLRVAHLEAGLRSHNRAMPEEHNRVLTDHAADLCLAPTRGALEQLAAEGLAARSAVVGDVMVDVLLRTRDAVAADPPPLPPACARGPYVLATLHRAENTDDPVRLGALLDLLAGLPLPVVLPVHPRLAAVAARAGRSLERGALRPCAPLAYPALVAAAAGARAVVTDSGGLQKEAFLLGVPCTTLRAETEWPETFEGGWNVLAGARELPAAGAFAATVLRGPGAVPVSAPFGDGRAAERVAEELLARP